MDDAQSRSIYDKWNICFDKPSDAVIMECGHGGIWFGWACTFINFDERCFIWRKEVSSIIQVRMNLI